jgi:hypothetical protein
MSDKYLGDFKKGQVIRVKFNTFSQAILPATPSVNPTVAIYKDSATEFTTGVTQPSVDFDGKAGFHELVIDTSDSVYEVGKDYDIVFTAGIVDSKNLTRTILRTFSIENRNVDANVTRIAGQTASAATPVAFPASVANETTVASRSTQTSVNAIPINPLLTTDSRLNNLDITISSRMPSGSVTVGTNNDKTGYSLSSGGISDIFAVLTSTLTTVGSVGKLIADNLNAAVASIPTANQNRDAVMNAMPNGGWVSGSFGDRWVIGVNNNREVQVTGSNHISADVHAMQNNTITNNALAASAITEIQSGLSTLTSAGIRDAIGLASNNLDTQLSNISGFIDTEISSIKTVVDKLDTALELDGSVYRFTTNALELAPTATDWTTDERAAIRAIFGIPTSGTSPVDPSSGILDTIRDLVVIVDSVTDAIEVDTQNIQSRIPASLIGGRIVANAEIVGDKTGYSLTQAFPTNFASLGINASGNISRVTLVDTTTTNTDMITASGIRSSIGLASANLDSQLSTIAGYIDTEIGSIKAKTDQMVFTTAGRLDTTAVAVLDKTGYTLSQAFPTNFSSLNINIDGKVLLQPTQTGVTIPTVTSITNFVGVSSIGTNVITSDVLATSAVDEIRSGLALETTSQSILSGVNTLTSRITAGVANMFQDLIAMIQGTGTGLVKWTASALSLAPAGSGGGGGNVTVNANILPIQSYMRKRIESETISLFYNESTDIFITLEDENGPIDVTGKTLEFVIETKNKTNLVVIPSGNIAKSSTGVSVRISTEVTANVGTYLWALRDLTGGDTVLSHGFAEVSYAPKS